MLFQARKMKKSLFKALHWSRGQPVGTPADTSKVAKIDIDDSEEVGELITE